MFSDADRAAELRRQYEAGTITADTYVAAGGDPLVVKQTEEERARDKAAATAAAEKSGTRWAIGCVTIPILLIGGCWAMASVGGSSTPTASDNMSGAQRICEKATSKQLRDPESASFSDVNVEITSSELPTYRYYVTGTVRATNGFGGTAVHEFACTATYNTDSDLLEGRSIIL